VVRTVAAVRQRTLEQVRPGEAVAEAPLQERERRGRY
jgi:hypothetical protein